MNLILKAVRCPICDNNPEATLKKGRTCIFCYSIGWVPPSVMEYYDKNNINIYQRFGRGANNYFDSTPHDVVAEHIVAANEPVEIVEMSESESNAEMPSV